MRPFPQRNRRKERHYTGLSAGLFQTLKTGEGKHQRFSFRSTVDVNHSSPGEGQADRQTCHREKQRVCVWGGVESREGIAHRELCLPGLQETLMLDLSSRFHPVCLPEHTMKQLSGLRASSDFPFLIRWGVQRVRVCLGPNQYFQSEKNVDFLGAGPGG